MVGTKQMKLELALLMAITTAAFLVRVWSVGTLPVGVLGDEAVSGLEARRILREGPIGLYSQGAAGLPAGTLYLMAASVALIGDNILALRLVTAILGTATIPVFYLLLRRYSGCGVAFALAGAVVLASSNWHVYYSRIAIPPVGLPLVAALATIPLMEAIQGGKRRWWIIAGLLHGTGIYVYDAYTPYLALVFLFVICLLVARKVKREAVLIFVLAVALTAMPMVAYVANPVNQYFLHLKRDAVWQQPQWQSASLGEKLTLLAGRYTAWWKTASAQRSEPDAVDGLATAIVPPLMLALAGIGVLTVRRQRRPLLYLALLVVLLLPISSAVTGTRLESSQGTLFSSSGYARRTFPMVIFLIVFIAWGLQVLAEYFRDGWVPHAMTLVLVSLVCFQNVQAYFRQFADPANQRWVFCREISDASRFMAELPQGRYIYFYSGHWSFSYEVRLFLAPNARGEDRSSKYGGGPPVALETDPGMGKPVFILLDEDRSLADLITARYPGSEVITGNGREDPSFIAILPP